VLAYSRQKAAATRAVQPQVLVLVRPAGPRQPQVLVPVRAAGPPNFLSERCRHLRRSLKEH